MNKTGKIKMKSNWTDYLYILPAVLLVVVYFISSITYTTYISFLTGMELVIKYLLDFKIMYLYSKTVISSFL